MAGFYIDEKEIIGKIKYGEFHINNLVKILEWALNKYKPQIIDMIIENPDISYNNIVPNQLVQLVQNDDIERFKKIISFMDLYNLESWSSDKLITAICYDNKIDFLNLIIDIPNLNFSFVIKKTFYMGYYEIISLLLQHRDEIRNDEKTYNKYAFILRAMKLKEIKEKM